MKAVILFAFSLLFTTSLHSQFTDNFMDGDFSSNPTWNGNSDRFIVNENGELQLQDVAPNSSNTSYLSTAVATSLTDLTTWEFYVRLEFSPSLTNFARVYLMASQADLSSDLNGYFVKIGGISGSDDALELYRQDGNRTELLISGTLGAVGAEPAIARVRVTRSSTGTWELLADYTGNFDFQLEGQATDATYDFGNFMGVFARYTSTRSSAFFFDDFFVEPLFVDRTPPEIVAVEALSTTEVEITFSEALAANTSENPANFSINNSIGNPQTATLVSFNTIFLQLNTPLESAVAYTLTVDGVADINGNVSANQTKNFIFYDIQPMQPGDVVINEILFNPEVGGQDFVELYNISDKTFNLLGITIANRAKISGDTSQFISSEFLLLPGAYVAIADDPQDIFDRYTVQNPAALLANDLPTLDDRSGNVTLLSNGVLIDAFDYSDDLHFALLDDDEGVSLERISPNVPTQSDNNWQSAAASAGFATPGYQNSQFFERNQMIDNLIDLPNKTFSPDGDGFEDILLIDYNADQPGLSVNVRVFDAQGRLVKRLVENELLAANGSFKWDGITDDGGKARIGIYVLWIELFTPNGRVEKRKEICVLAGKLN